jgi:hypothetical protein
MKHIKPSINVKYSIEVNNGTGWEEVRSFTRIQIAIDYLDELKEMNPNMYYRFIRSEWQVME